MFHLMRFPRLFYMATLGFLIHQYVFSHFNYPPELFEPRGLFRLIPLSMPEPTVMNAIYILTAFSLILVIIQDRIPVRILAFVLCFYVFGIRYNYGYLSHLDAGTTVALGVMAMARPGEFWPLRFISGYLILIFFMAGLQKLYRDGWAWAASDPVAQIIWRDRLVLYPADTEQISSLGMFLIHSGLSVLLSYYVLALELAAPLALFARRAFVFIFPQLILILIGIQLTIGRNFIYSLLPLIIAGWFYIRETRPPRALSPSRP